MTRRLLTALTGALLLLAGAVPASADAADVVRIDAGSLRGFTAGGHRAFLGVPYARPPVGALRWKAPERPAAWPGVRDATRYGAICPQPATDFGGAVDTEDCLNLNVYAPTGAETAGLPVIVWLHGGSWAFGDANGDAGGLAEAAHAVVVAVNFRQGLFGNLALESLRTEDPALNYTTQDQQEALRWVARNIGAFGGDPRQVTLMGQSSGSIGVCANYASPAASGLFQRAVLLSGSVCGSEKTYGTTLANATKTGSAFAAKVGCPDGPGQLACLRAKPARELLDAAPFTQGPNTPFFFPQVLDGVVIPDTPVSMIKSGRVPVRPILAGTTSDEGYLFAALGLKANHGVEPTEADYQKLMTEFAGAAAPIATFLYPSWRYGSPLKALSALMGDMLFGCATDTGLQEAAPLAPTYAYLFDDPGAPPILPGLSPASTHAADLPYFFDPKSAAFTPEQTALSAQMSAYLASFVRNGDPATSGQPAWPRYDRTAQHLRHLRPGGPAGTTGPGYLYLGHRCYIWNLVGGFITF
ncbi:Para-nitrobenzyl esterase [Actinomadura rubteroloni]|uniref:Carboxylic ester hydrolase n=1 Tax=Actinomadura rubteroloni TaxID=1926885 RepID=A0A2P4UDM1_9ACTN|nr:carboxylesterase family protein [Actinomadura rubteroloni]POM23148.1 Para-nitrobenzyl esterase [Actinomadura rubteroloni]